jgi:hypothetical protein
MIFAVQKGREFLEQVNANLLFNYGEYSYADMRNMAVVLK